MLSAVMEDYIKAMYVLENEAGERVATSALADYLDVTPPTVSSMLTKLEERGLIDREQYKGATLTEEGELVALEILRHHRLLEAFLTEHLDYDWADVHDEADRLEHHISDELSERIAEALDNPGVDPHGDPIPGADLEPVEDDTTPLSAHEMGDRVVVARVRDRDEGELAYLAEAGIEPGVALDLVDVTPIGVYVVAHADGERHLPANVAETIRVRAAEGGEREPAGEPSA